LGRWRSAGRVGYAEEAFRWGGVQQRHGSGCASSSEACCGLRADASMGFSTEPADITAEPIQEASMVPIPIEKALLSLVRAFNEHDLDAIMAHFAEDAALEMPRDPDSWGHRFVGKANVREGLASHIHSLGSFARFDLCQSRSPRHQTA
jgi:SnoaL-like domain